MQQGSYVSWGPWASGHAVRPSRTETTCLGQRNACALRPTGHVAPPSPDLPLGQGRHHGGCLSVQCCLSMQYTDYTCSLSCAGPVCVPSAAVRDQAVRGGRGLHLPGPHQAHAGGSNWCYTGWGGSSETCAGRSEHCACDQGSLPVLTMFEFPQVSVDNVRVWVAPNGVVLCSDQQVIEASISFICRFCTASFI